MMNENTWNDNGRLKVNPEDLINRTKAEDLKNSKTLKSLYYLYLGMSVFYILLFVANPDPDLTGNDRLAGLCYAAAFVAGTLIFRRESRFLRKLDYTVSLLELVRSIEARYRFFNYKWLYLLFIVSTIGAGLFFSFRNPARLAMLPQPEKLFIVQAVYWSVISVAAFIGYSLWKKRSYPVWKDSKILLGELEG